MASTALQIAIEHFDVAASRATLAELGDVHKRDKFDRYASKDRKDNKFLALCTTAGAKVLVTGDKKDLLVMHPYQNTAVSGLRAFVDGYGAYL